MNKLKKIILTTDFSEEARKAYPVASGLAEQFGAKVHLVHFRNRKAPEHSGISNEQHLRDVLKALNEELRLEVFSKVSVSAKRLDRNVGKSLALFEDELQSDLLVTAIRRRKGLDHFILSDIGEEVLAKTTRNALVYASLQSADHRLTFDRVLVPFVSADGMFDAIPTVRFLAGNFNSTFQFLFVGKNDRQKQGWIWRWFNSDKSELSRSQEGFSGLVESELAGVKAEFVSAQGDPAKTIVGQTQKADFQLVLLGQRNFRSNLAKRIIYAGGKCSIMKLAKSESVG